MTKYNYNKKIFSISGYNPLKKLKLNKTIFSNIFLGVGQHGEIDGWLKKFIPNSKWKNSLKSSDWQLFLDDNIKKRYFSRIYNLMSENKIDSWAFLVTIWSNDKSKFVVPKYNLVKNTEPKLMELIMFQVNSNMLI